LRIKAGLGYDLHKLMEGRELYLGGIKIPFSKGLLGHSDGDCLIHAIIDALLGALGEKDIGQFFPDTDPQYKNIRSIELLKKVAPLIYDKKAEILNVDSVIIAEEPSLAAFIPQMKETLCPILRIKEEDMGIKAKTHEGLSAIGKGDAISAWAVVLIQKE